MTSDEDKTAKDCFMYRAYIAQNKFKIALDEITGSSKPELQAVRTLADYLANERRRLVTAHFTRLFITIRDW